MRPEIPPLSTPFTGPAIILLAAAIAVTPQLIRGNSCGHDFDFHLVSWFNCLNSWGHGILYPNWAPSANYGAGEPRFVFYPPLTWMLGAALGLFIPWPLAPIALTFLLLAATGLATRALARQALSDAPATLAGCAALFSGYTLFCAYERSAFGELTGGFWIPLLLLFALRDRNPPAPLLKRAMDGSTAALALVVAGAWLSNVPVGIMVCYLLAAVALASALLAKSWAPILRASAAAALGIGMAAIYLIPATWEQRWVDVRQVTDDPGERIENSWLFARHADPSLALHDAELHRVSLIAISMLAVALASLLVAWWRGKLAGQRHWWIPLALIPVAILLLQLPISLPVWNMLPKLRLLQFPWRWLVVLEAPMAIFFVAAVWPRNPAHRWQRRAVIFLCATAFLAATVASGVSFLQVCDDEDAVIPMVNVYRTGPGFAGTDEYAPPGSDNSLLSTGLPAACLVTDPNTKLGSGRTADTPPTWQPKQGTCNKTFASAPNSGNPEHLRLTAITDHPGYLVLRLRSYPAWSATLDGRPIPTPPAREDGLMVVPVPPGLVNLAIDWTTTPDVLAGRWVSFLAFLLLAALLFLERRLTRPRLS